MSQATGSPCCGESQHPDYSKELPRLNRISGQVDGVKRMIDARKYCPDILAQLRAIRAAINSIEASILETHLDACVTDAFNAGDAAEKRAKIAELKALYRRFNE